MSHLLWLHCLDRRLLFVPDGMVLQNMSIHKTQLCWSLNMYSIPIEMANFLVYIPMSMLWVRLTFCAIGSQPASLLAAIGQSSSHVTKYHTVRLWVGQIVGGRRTGDLTILSPCPWSQHSTWFPLGDWPTWPRLGKWHKWAPQPIIYIGTTFRDHLQSSIYIT